MTICSGRFERVAAEGGAKLVDLVRPLQGSDSRFSFSSGNTYPAVAVPHGMTAWTPQTDEGRFIYEYRQPKCQGIRATHEPSPWMGDYGAMTFMPVIGPVLGSAEARASVFRHEDEFARPDYYRIYLRRYRLLSEVTASARCAMLRLSYPADADPALCIQPIAGESFIQIESHSSRIVGYTRGNNGGCPDNFACYYVIELDTPISSAGILGDEGVQADTTSATGQRVGGYVRLSAAAGRTVHARIGTSFISIEQAAANLVQEVGPSSFEELRTASRSQWEQLLQRLVIQTDDPGQERTFYTALYRSLLFPRMFHEIDASGIHTRSSCEQTHKYACVSHQRLMAGGRLDLCQPTAIQSTRSATAGNISNDCC